MKRRDALLAYSFSILGLLLTNGATFCYLFQSNGNTWTDYPYRGFTWILLPLGILMLILGASFMLMVTEEPPP